MTPTATCASTQGSETAPSPTSGSSGPAGSTRSAASARIGSGHFRITGLVGHAGRMSGYASPDRPDQRLSDAERDEAVGHLAQANVEGRITTEEYGERSAAA